MRFSVKSMATMLLGAALPAAVSAQATPSVTLGAPVGVVNPAEPAAPGGAAPAVPAAPAPPAGIAPVGVAPVEDSGIPPITQRWSLRRDFGDGIGYDNGYTYLEGFIPVLRGDRSITFANVRIVNFDQSQYWEAQGGGGSRWMLDNVVVGVNGFYDGRNTQYHWYNQAGFGWELLGRCWEARGNFYVPFGQQRYQIGQTGFFNPRFLNTNIAVSQTQFFESSAGGLDFEVGRQLPSLTGAARTLAYVGGYHYDNERIQTTNGVRARLESWVGENLSLHLAIQNDNVYDTTVTGGLALHYGGVRKGFRAQDPLAAKLGSRVVRDPNVVLQRTSETHDELLIDPVTMKPIEVRHANSNAPAGGDGSVEHPYQNLSQLQNGSGPQMILFLHANSTFKGQNIVLQPNQRMLGEGIDHIVVATQGTYLLPRATNGTILPIILNSPGNAAITLASNTEVSGIQILSPNLNGIYGDSISNVNVNRNVIRDVQGFFEEESVAAGVNLINVTGTSSIRDNLITTTQNNSMSAINLTYGGTSQATLYVTGNVMQDLATPFSSMSGISMFADGSSSILGYFNRNQFSQIVSNSNDAIFIQQAGKSTGTYQVALNNVQNAGITIFSSGFDTATLNLQLLQNTAGSIGLARFGTSTFNIENTLATNSPAGSFFFGSPTNVYPFGYFKFPPP